MTRRQPPDPAHAAVVVQVHDDVAGGRALDAAVLDGDAALGWIADLLKNTGLQVDMVRCTEES